MYWFVTPAPEIHNRSAENEKGSTSYIHKLWTLSWGMLQEQGVSSELFSSWWTSSCSFFCIPPEVHRYLWTQSRVLLGKVVLQHRTEGLNYLTREIICSWDSTNREDLVTHNSFVTLLFWQLFFENAKEHEHHFASCAFLCSNQLCMLYAVYLTMS